MPPPPIPHIRRLRLIRQNTLNGLPHLRRRTVNPHPISHPPHRTCFLTGQPPLFSRLRYRSGTTTRIRVGVFSSGSGFWLVRWASSGIRFTYPFFVIFPARSSRNKYVRTPPATCNVNARPLVRRAHLFHLLRGWLRKPRRSWHSASQRRLLLGRSEPQGWMERTCAWKRSVACV